MKKAITNCTKCGSRNYIKNGRYDGVQRYICNECGETFTDKVEKHSKEKKDFALYLYLNNSGVRVISRILKISPSLVLRWIKKGHEHLEKMFNERQGKRVEPEVIELDEIYTYVKKNLKEQSYGLLIAENKSVLLRLPSETKE